MVKVKYKIADSTSRAYKRGLIISGTGFKKPPAKKPTNNKEKT